MEQKFKYYILTFYLGLLLGAGHLSVAATKKPPQDKLSIGQHSENLINFMNADVEVEFFKTIDNKIQIALNILQINPNDSVLKTDPLSSYNHTHTVYKRFLELNNEEGLLQKSKKYWGEEVFNSVVTNDISTFKKIWKSDNQLLRQGLKLSIFDDNPNLHATTNNLLLLAIQYNAIDIFQLILNDKNTKAWFQPKLYTNQELTVIASTTSKAKTATAKNINMILDPLSLALLQHYRMKVFLTKLELRLQKTKQQIQENKKMHQESIKNSTKKSKLLATIENLNTTKLNQRGSVSFTKNLLKTNIKIINHLIDHPYTNLEYKNALQFNALEMAILTDNTEVFKNIHDKKSMAIPSVVRNLKFEKSTLKKIIEPSKSSGINSFNFDYLLLTKYFERKDMEILLQDRILNSKFNEDVEHLLEDRSLKSKFNSDETLGTFAEYLQLTKTVYQYIKNKSQETRQKDNFTFNISFAINQYAKYEFKKQQENYPLKANQNDNFEAQVFTRELRLINELIDNVKNSLNLLHIDIDTLPQMLDSMIRGYFLLYWPQRILAMQQNLSKSEMLAFETDDLKVIQSLHSKFKSSPFNSNIERVYDPQIVENQGKLFELQKELIEAQYQQNLSTNNPISPAVNHRIVFYNQVLFAIENDSPKILKFLIADNPEIWQPNISYNEEFPFLLRQVYPTNQSPSLTASENPKPLNIYLDPLSMAITRFWELQTIQNNVTEGLMKVELADKKTTRTTLTKNETKFYLKKIENKLKNSQKIIDFLVEHPKVNLNYVNFLNLSIIEMAIISGNLKLVKKLHEEKHIPLPKILWNLDLDTLEFRDSDKVPTRIKSKYNGDTINLGFLEKVSFDYVSLSKSLGFAFMHDYLKSKNQIPSIDTKKSLDTKKSSKLRLKEEEQRKIQNEFFSTCRKTFH